MSQTKKAESLIRLLKQNLQFRLKAAYPAMTFTDSQDANGYPCLTIVDGTWATTKAACAIRITTVKTAFLNSIQLAQEVYTPHSVECSFEGVGATPVTPVASSYFTRQVEIEIDRLGMLSRTLIVPVTTQPAVAQFDTVPANSFDQTFANDVFWPLSGQ